MDLPRQLSLKLKLSVLFANILFSMGLVFFLMGSAFIAIFSPQTDFITPFHFKDTDPAVPGVVVNVEETNTSENKRLVYKNTATYVVGGKEYSTESYSRGMHVSPTETVTIQYEPGNPSLSRIQGMRKAPFSLFFLLVFTPFPLTGLVLLLIGLRRSLINLRLLRNGILTTGKVVRKEATGSKVNKQTVYKVYFNFTTKDGLLTESMVRTHRPNLVEDEEREQLVYDTVHPQKAVLIDTLPRSVRKFLEQL
jgi:hypothetical protein